MLLTRSDSGNSNSTFWLYDGTTQITSTAAAGQFSGDVTVVLTINADGSGTLVVNGQSTSFGARTWTNGKGNLFVYAAENGNDGLGQTNQGGVDTISFTYTQVSGGTITMMGV